MKKHNIYYLLLAGILLIGLGLISLFSYNKQLQMMIVILTASLYIAFGIVHHIKDHDISLKVVIEYFAFAVLGISIIYLVIKPLM